MNCNMQLTAGCAHPGGARAAGSAGSNRGRVTREARQAQRSALYRLGPTGTAWYRIKFFLPPSPGSFRLRPATARRVGATSRAKMRKNNCGKPRLSVLLRALASLGLCTDAKSRGRKAAGTDGLMGSGQGWNKPTPAFAGLRRDTQVVDISSKKAKSCVRLCSDASAFTRLRRDKPARQVVSWLISRRLGRKTRIFDPFLGSSLFSVE